MATVQEQYRCIPKKPCDMASKVAVISFIGFFGFFGFFGCQQAKSSGPECRQGEGLSSYGVNGASLAVGNYALSFVGGVSGDVATVGEYLGQQGIRAVFFASGRDVLDARSTLQRLHDAGQIVGNGLLYGDDAKHPADPATAARRIDHLISEYVIGDIFLMRLPGAGIDETQIETLNKSGFAKYAGPIRPDIGGPEGVNGSGISLNSCKNSDSSSCVQLILKSMRQVGRGLIEVPTNLPFLITLVRDLVVEAGLAGFSWADVDLIPDLQYRIQRSGGTPGAPIDQGSCNDY